MRRIKRYKRKQEPVKWWRSPRAVIWLVILAGLLGLMITCEADSFRPGRTMTATAVGIDQAQSDGPSATRVRAKLDDGRIVVLLESDGVYCPKGKRLRVRELTSRLFGHKAYQFIGFEEDDEGAVD